jgi:dolichol-phosphate mannosyltransferase
MDKKLISIILPIFNEAETIDVLYDRLCGVIDSLSATNNFEIIMINDGSVDDSWKKISQLAHLDTRIKGISFSRNFGHQIAISAGYDYAQGDAIITMDADLQHPPQLIPVLIESWRNGAAIVYVRNREQVNGFFKKFTSAAYYKLLDRIVSIKIPSHVQDFRLIDKKVAKIICQSRERSPYLRGMVAWTGFPAAYIDAAYDKRFNGKSGYSLSKMFKLAFDGMTGFSLFPLKIAAYIGSFVIFTGCAMFTYITVDAFFYRVYYPLFKWLVTMIYIFIGVLFILIWFLGEYIGRIYNQLQARPLYVVAEQLNFLSHNQTVKKQNDMYLQGEQ